MRKICIVVPWEFPVPSILGGALETLVGYLLEENEKEPHFEFTVLTVYESGIEKITESYRHSKFVFFKKSVLDHPWFLLFRLLKKTLGIYIPCSPRFISVLGWLKLHKDYDVLLFEAGSDYMLPLVARHCPPAKILCHLHWDGDPSIRMDRCFSRLIAVSQFIAQNWSHFTRREAKGIAVLKNCCNYDVFAQPVAHSVKTALRRELNIREDSFTLIYVGRLVPEKGILQLLQALEEVSDPSISLILIGSANFGVKTKTRFEAKVERRLAHARYQVRRLGFIKNEELYKYYAIADAAVMPTQYEEAASVVNVETMATGTPLIATRSGGTPEYLTEETAILIEKGAQYTKLLAEAIVRLRDDPPLRDRMRAAALREAQKYTTGVYFQNFVRVIEETDG